MAANPLIQQGTLNRLIGSVQIPLFPALNVTPPYLGKEGIKLDLEGAATTFIETMTGNVTSGEPYRMVMVSINLLKTQALAAAWQAQELLQSVIGDITVRPDTNSLPPYALSNCGIEGVRSLSFNGQDAGYIVTVRGAWYINANLWAQL